MEDNFKFEIVSPEKVIFSDNTTMVTLPSYEGDMSVLKNHISIITFLNWFVQILEIIGIVGLVSDKLKEKKHG